MTCYTFVDGKFEATGNIAIDNIKLWDFAKTDYSDRFVEGFDDDATISELLERIETLEERVKEQAQQLMELEEYPANHSHTYLTGKGRGHNDTEVSTRPAELAG